VMCFDQLKRGGVQLWKAGSAYGRRRSHAEPRSALFWGRGRKVSLGWEWERDKREEVKQGRETEESRRVG